MEQEKKPLPEENAPETKTENMSGTQAIEEKDQGEKDTKEALEEAEKGRESLSNAAGQEAGAVSQQNQNGDFGKVMTLRYHISLDQYYQFQILLGKAQFDKSKKRNTIFGLVEVGLGAAYLISMLVAALSGNPVPAGLTPYVMAVIIIGLGLYSMIFYRVLFDKRFYKMLSAQYQKMTYLHNEITIDLYPNHCTEFYDGEPQESYYYNMKGVKENDDFFILFLEERRCLLIPKASIPDHVLEVSDYLDQICENFEKPRKMA